MRMQDIVIGGCDRFSELNHYFGYLNSYVGIMKFEY